jgi:hypothetical protein
LFAATPVVFREDGRRRVGDDSPVEIAEISENLAEILASDDSKVFKLFLKTIDFLVETLAFMGRRLV